MKLLVIGATGQLGRDLVPALAGEEVVPLSHADLELRDNAGMQAVVDGYRPDVVINLAAYHRVDDCEVQPETAFLVNALAVRQLARACRDYASALLHVSTDYVFDGRKGEAYTESDAPNPLSVYGASKVAGEYLVRHTLDRHYIVRTSGLYGLAGSSGKGGNFVERMLQLAREGKPIRVVADQVLTPTYTVDVAAKISELVRTERWGTYHLTNAGQCSWYEFATRIFELAQLEADLSPTTSAEFGARALRPAFSVLRSERLGLTGLSALRPWGEALAAYLQARGEDRAGPGVVEARASAGAFQA